jgi:hypothetical protein
LAPAGNLRCCIWCLGYVQLAVCGFLNLGEHVKFPPGWIQEEVRNRFSGFCPTFFLKIHYTTIIRKRRSLKCIEEPCVVVMFARALKVGPFTNFFLQ